MELPIIIDIEASGFGKGSYPIEIGYFMPDGSSFCALIRPEASWTHWDSSAEAVHGIAREQLASHGKSAVDVCLALNRNLRGLEEFGSGWPAGGNANGAKVGQPCPEDRPPRWSVHLS